MPSTTLLEFSFAFVTAVLCGALGQFISGASKGGCTVSVIAALIGAYAGPRLAIWLEYPEPWPVTVPLTEGEYVWPAATTLAGALVLVLIVNLITRGRRW